MADDYGVGQEIIKDDTFGVAAPIPLKHKSPYGIANFHLKK